MQPIFMINSAASAAVAAPLIGAWDFSSTFCEIPIPIPGTFNNWKSVARTAVAAGTSRTLHFQKNNVTAMSTAAFTDAVLDGSNLAGSVAVVAGDTIRFNQTRVGAPAGQTFDQSIEWTPDDGVSQLYAWGSTSLIGSTGGSHFIGLLGDNFRATSDTDKAALIAVAGTITGYLIKTNLAPGAGKTVVYTIYLNGIAQDGTGGTVDTRVTLADTNATASGAFSLPIAVGDRVSIRHHVLTGPIAFIACMGCMTFEPTTAGQMHYGFVTPVPLGGGPATQYWYPTAPRVGPLSTEASRAILGAPTSLTFTGMRVSLSSDELDPGEARTYTLIKNGSPTGITVTIDDASYVPETVYGVTFSVELTNGDTWTIQEVITGNVTGGGVARVALVTGTVAPTIQGSALFGVHTDVKATRAIAMGLDGNTNVLTESGKFKVYGNVEVTGTVESGTLGSSFSTALDELES